MYTYAFFWLSVIVFSPPKPQRMLLARYNPLNSTTKRQIRFEQGVLSPEKQPERLTSHKMDISGSDAFQRCTVFMLFSCAVIEAGRPDYTVAGNGARTGTWWERQWDDDCSAVCDGVNPTSTGTRTLTVKCMKDHIEQSNLDWCTATGAGANPGDATEACTVQCYYVDPLNGNDANAGQARQSNDGWGQGDK